jgi:excisionase family DNA binding protein
VDHELLEAIRQIVRDELQRRAEDELLDVDGLAEALKVPKSWVYENCRLGKIPTVRIGKYVRFRLNDVLKKGGTNGND